MSPAAGSAQAILSAVSSPRRRRILKLVWDAERSAGEIAAAFEVSWPAVSQNLRMLRESGLVVERREGTRRLYRANREALGSLEGFIRQMWEQELDRLGELAEQEAHERRGR